MFCFVEKLRPTYFYVIRLALKTTLDFEPVKCYVIDVGYTYRNAMAC